MFIEGLELCINNGYFLYNDVVYRQVFGVAMGGSLSVAISGLLLDHVLDKVIKNTGIKPLMLIKYVDDILAIMNRDDIETFLLELNSIHQRLKFTCEWEINGKINYLDITLLRRSGRIYTKWFRKPLAKNLVLNFYSKHPYRYKKNLTHNFMIKAIRLTDNCNRREIRYKIFKLFLDNWYPVEFLKNQWKICLKQVHSVELTCNINKKQTPEYRSLDFIDGLSDKIAKLFKNHEINNIQLALKPINKISMLLHNLKDNIKINKQNDVIYKLQCLDCKQVYIGHTSMWIEMRIKHHKSNAKTNTTTNTALSTHVINNNHKIDWDNVIILHKENKTSKRRILESIYIQKHDKVIMNDRREIGKVGYMYADCLNRINKDHK